MMVALLVADRADHWVAAHGRHVVVQLQPRSGLRRTWRYWCAVVPALTSSVLLLFLPWLVGQLLVKAVSLVVSFALLSWVPLALLVCSVAPVVVVPSLMLGSLALSERATARRHARMNNVVLVEAAGLASDAKDFALTVLVRRLGTHTDSLGIAVTALPRTPELAQRYINMGFTPVAEGARLLQRNPGARRTIVTPSPAYLGPTVEVADAGTPRPRRSADRAGEEPS